MSNTASHNEQSPHRIAASFRKMAFECKRMRNIPIEFKTPFITACDKAAEMYSTEGRLGDPLAEEISFMPAVILEKVLFMHLWPGKKVPDDVNGLFRRSKALHSAGERFW